MSLPAASRFAGNAFTRRVECDTFERLALQATSMESEQPFSGVRVVEFGQFVAVPFCGQLLADGGAEVIKVESLVGDSSRHAAPVAPGVTRVFLGRNRGKRSLPLNLRHPQARPVIDALLSWADVVLMNFRPGLAEELSLGSLELKRRFPELVIGAVTPFGTKGPDAQLAGMDVVVQARSGLMAAQGRIVDGRPASGEPVPADYMCAMTLAFGVASALFRRERTQRGASIDVSLMHAAMTLANNQMIRIDRQDEQKHRDILTRLEQQRRDRAGYQEQLQTVLGAQFRPIAFVYFRSYSTADGYVAIGCGSRQLRARFIEALDLSDEALEQGEPGGDEWLAHYESLRQRVEQVMAGKSTEHWLSALIPLGIPIAPVKMPVELLDDPQALANEMIVRQDHPQAGPVTLLGPPLALDESGFAAAPPTAPLGSETRQLLTELGFDAQNAQALIDAQVTKEA